MGVVKRQGGKESIVSYVATLIGAVNTIFLYPLAYSTSELGFIRFIVDLGLLATPFIMLGFNSVSIRFFPEFKDQDDNRGGFFSLLLLASIVGSLIFLFLGWIFYDQICELYSSEGNKYASMIHYLFPVAILTALMHTVSTYCTNFFRIVVPTILNNLLIKVGFGAFAVFYFQKFISFPQIMMGILLLFTLLNIAIFAYLFSLGELKFGNPFKNINGQKAKEIGSYSAWGLLGGIGAKLATRIDAIMIPTLLNFGSNGVYSIALFMGTVLEIPKKSLSKITSPMVAEAWNKNDFGKLNELYKRISSVQIIVGCILSLLIWTNIDHLYDIMPNGENYKAGKVAVYILCLKGLMDMAFSNSTEIINYSKYYRINFAASLGMAIINITLNIILIPRIGIMGAALATLISICVYDVFKFLFLLQKNLQPFTAKSSFTLAVAALVAGGVYFLPGLGNPFIDAIWQSVFVVLVYVSSIYFLRLNSDVNLVLDSIPSKLNHLMNRE